MSAQEFSLESGGGGESLGDIIAELLREPYGQEQQLADSTLEQLGKTLEDAAEEFDQPGLPPDLQAQAKSYERCKDAYCRLLLELENQGITPASDETLKQLATRGREDVAMRPDEVPEPELPVEEFLTPDDQGGLDLPPLDLDAAFGNNETPIDADEAQSIGGGMRPVEAIWDEAAKQAEESPDEKTKITFEELISTPPPEPRDDSSRETPSPLRPPGGKLRLAAPPEDEEENVEELVSLPKAPLPRTGENTTRAQGVTGELLQLADYLESLKVKGFPLPGQYVDRLAAQSLCFAVETECIEKLSAALERFWPDRESAIHALFAWEGGKFGVAPAVRRAIEELVEEHEDWLPGGRFPFAPASNALRFMVATPEAEGFRPALIDCGLLLLLFAQERTMGKVPLKNLLGVHGLSPAEIVELGLRLIGMQKLRNQTLTPAPEKAPAEALLDRIDTEAHACLNLLAKAGTGGGDD